MKREDSLKMMFLTTLEERLPNIGTFSQDALDNVYNVFVRKLCNTRVQEVVSATKQQMVSKKGLASTVDVNLRPVLLAQHTKLETKLGAKKPKKL